MILLDTNIVSEVMKPIPSPVVLAWLNQQPLSTLFVSAVTIGEIEYGLRILPIGKRRSTLQERFERFLQGGFTRRILGFDEAAARSYGELMSHRKALGRPMSIPDGQIAGIARSNGCTLATRNIADFEACGIHLINPFEI
ncbi:PIN domain-containing protein [Methylomagnum sp.]